MAESKENQLPLFWEEYRNQNGLRGLRALRNIIDPKRKKIIFFFSPLT